jgi:hypothetical protein
MYKSSLPIRPGYPLSRARSSMFSDPPGEALCASGELLCDLRGAGITTGEALPGTGLMSSARGGWADALSLGAGLGVPRAPAAYGLPLSDRGGALSCVGAGALFAVKVVEPLV